MRKWRAVVIDDEEIIVHLLKDCLSLGSYEVLSYTGPVICPISYEKIKRCSVD